MDKLKKEQTGKKYEVTVSSTIIKLKSILVSDSKAKLSSWEIIEALIRLEAKKIHDRISPTIVF